MREIHAADIDLNLLVLFHVVYMERSVTRAAEKLRVTQSAASHSLAKLRQLFQDDLLVRASGKMVPTPRADQLFEAVSVMIDALESRILPVANFEPRTARREFSTAMSDMAEVVALPPLMQALRRQAPGCTIRNVRVTTSEITDALETGRAELAIGNVFEPQSNIYQQTLYMHDYAVLAWERHPRLRKGLTLERYLAEPHVVAETGSEDHLRTTGLSPLGLRRRTEVTVGGLMSIPWLLPDTDLLATVPSHLGRIACKKFGLRAHALPFQVPAYAIKTYWHPRSHSDAGHRWFREHVYQVMRSYPEWSV
jgi:DNA-binding transcriptional LysR family regulator